MEQNLRSMELLLGVSKVITDLYNPQTDMNTPVLSR